MTAGNLQMLPTFQSVGFTAAYATRITTSKSSGFGFGPGPTSVDRAFSVGSQAAWLCKIAAIAVNSSDGSGNEVCQETER